MAFVSNNNHVTNKTSDVNATAISESVLNCNITGVGVHKNAQFYLTQEQYPVKQAPGTSLIIPFPSSVFTPWGQQIPSTTVTWPNTTAEAICSKCTKKAAYFFQFVCCADDSEPTFLNNLCTCSDGNQCANCGPNVIDNSFLCSPSLYNCATNISKTDSRTWCCSGSKPPAESQGYDCICGGAHGDPETDLCRLCGGSSTGAKSEGTVKSAVSFSFLVFTLWVFFSRS